MTQTLDVHLLQTHTEFDPVGDPGEFVSLKEHERQPCVTQPAVGNNWEGENGHLTDVCVIEESGRAVGEEERRQTGRGGV